MSVRQWTEVVSVIVSQPYKLQSRNYQLRFVAEIGVIQRRELEVWGLDRGI